MTDSLEEHLQSAENTVDLLRNTDFEFDQYIFPDEYTNWALFRRLISPV